MSEDNQNIPTLSVMSPRGKPVLFTADDIASISRTDPADRNSWHLCLTDAGARKLGFRTDEKMKTGLQFVVPFSDDDIEAFKPVLTERFLKIPYLDREGKTPVVYPDNYVQKTKISMIVTGPDSNSVAIKGHDIAFEATAEGLEIIQQENLAFNVYNSPEIHCVILINPECPEIVEEIEFKIKEAMYESRGQLPPDNDSGPVMN